MHPTVCPLMWNIIVVWYRLKGWQNTTSAILAFASSEQKFMQGVHQTIQKARQRLWLHQASRIDSHDLFCACLLVNVCLARVCLGGRIRSETCSHYNIVARLCGNGKLLPTSNFFHWLQLPFFFFLKALRAVITELMKSIQFLGPFPTFKSLWSMRNPGETGYFGWECLINKTSRTELQTMWLFSWLPEFSWWGRLSRARVFTGWGLMIISFRSEKVIWPYLVIRLGRPGNP